MAWDPLPEGRQPKETNLFFGAHPDPMCSSYFGVASYSILHLPQNPKPRTALVCWIHLVQNPKEMSEKGRNRFLTEDLTQVGIGFLMSSTTQPPEIYPVIFLQLTFIKTFGILSKARPLTARPKKHVSITHHIALTRYCKGKKSTQRVLPKSAEMGIRVLTSGISISKSIPKS